MNAISLARVSAYSFNDEIAVSLVEEAINEIVGIHRNRLSNSRYL
jgi:hypothetical protein